MPEVFILLKAKDQASATIKGIAKESDGLKKTLIGAGLFGATAIVGIGTALGKLAYDAAMVEPVRITFDNLTASIGATADEMLDALKPATMGVLSEIELMKAANKLMAMGLANSVEEAAALAEMAVTLGISMGEEAGPAIENFTLMLANQSIPRMDTYGLSSGQARLRIEELMAATEELTREEAFKIAVMEQGADAMERVGDVSGTAAVKMGAFQTKVTDAKDDLGTALIPVLEILLDEAIGPLIDTLADDLIPILATELPEALENTIEVFRTWGEWLGTILGFVEQLEEKWKIISALALLATAGAGGPMVKALSMPAPAPPEELGTQPAAPAPVPPPAPAPIELNVYGLPGLEEEIREIIRNEGRLTP